MPKLILLVVATLFLVHPSLQLNCYNCKSDTLPSKTQIAANLIKCPNNIQDWPTLEKKSIGFPQCLKLLEKVNVAGEDQTLIIRTIVTGKIELPQNSEAIYCTDDLCNSGFSTEATVAVLLLSMVAAAFIR